MKESFYFSHDFNARNDPKILMLRGEFGNEGYALYFYCVETMAEDTLGYIYRGAIGGLSIGYGVAKDYLSKFIDYTIKINLFIENEFGIYSQRMMAHKNARKLLSEKGKEGADKRWNQNKNRGANGGAIDTPMAIKEKKVKESKVKEIKIKKEGTASDADPEEQKLLSKLAILENHEYFKNPEFLEKWTTFNKQKGKKATIDAKITGLNKLFRFSLTESITALENSICSHWAGVFPESVKEKVSNSQKLNKIQRVDKMVGEALAEVVEAKQKGEAVHVLGDLSWLQPEEKTVPKQIGTV